MRVLIYVINEGQRGQYYGLKNAETGDILYSAPHNWRTIGGACKWAFKHGYIVKDIDN